jgi:hypothetical protein
MELALEKEDDSTHPTRTFCFHISAKEIMSNPVGLKVGTNASGGVHYV